MSITLKTPTWEDMAYIRWLWSDPESMAPVGGPIPLSDQGARRWFADVIDPGSDTGRYCLILDPCGQPVGEISFHHLDRQQMRARFNIKIAADARGQGYAHQAMLRFLDEFFNQLGGREMVDDIALDNLRGQQVLLDFGFVHDPSQEDVFLVRLTRQRFNALYRQDLV